MTISEFAAYGGVSVKTVRHYHRLGLLHEPPRDSAGYRRYPPQHLIELIKIRTLATAGIPLARIREMMAADRDGFAIAAAEVGRDLRTRAADATRKQELILQLCARRELFIPDEVTLYLDELREAGISPRGVKLERDVWVLTQALSPEHAALWAREKLDFFQDAEFRELYFLYDAAFEWPAQDERLPSLANRTIRWLADRVQSHSAAPPTRVVNLIEKATNTTSPAWQRLTEIIKEQASSH